MDSGLAAARRPGMTRERSKVATARACWRGPLPAAGLLRSAAALRAAAAAGRAAERRVRGRGVRRRRLGRGLRRRLGRGLRRRLGRGLRLPGRLLRGGLLRNDALLLARRGGFFRLPPLLGLRLRFLRLLRHDGLPIVTAQIPVRRRHYHIAIATVSPAALDTPLPVSASGAGPPVAQSINSTVWTTGISVPAAICVMQPILPAAITSGLSFSIFPTLRSRNLLASSGCSMLYVPAEPQHRCPSATSFTTNPNLQSNSFGA